MKALSVRQPHASDILSGRKTLEIRSRQTHHRGDLLICVTAKPVFDDLPTGMALCIVRLVECRPMKARDAKAARCSYQPGHFAYILEDVRPVRPVSVKGKLGFFNVDDALIECA